MTPCLPLRRALLKKRLPHPPVVTCCLRPRGFGQIRPRATRGLLIRLLEVRRGQMSQSFQLVRNQGHQQTLIWVPCGWVYSWAGASGTSFLHPALTVEMAQHDGAIEKGEADPQAVGGEQRQDGPQERALEQVVERAEQQAPQTVPVAQDDFCLAVEGPRRAYRHADFLAGWFQCQRNKIGQQRSSGYFLVRYLPARRTGASASLGRVLGWICRASRANVLLAQYNAATRAYRCICRRLLRDTATCNYKAGKLIVQLTSQYFHRSCLNFEKPSKALEYEDKRDAIDSDIERPEYT